MKRNSFSGSLGFVLAAAGSAVGLGNIWRFPYLAARDGGGLFLVVYLFLALTFGYTLLTTEIAIGRKTKESALTAYGQLNEKAKPIGFLACIIPMMILPYYCVIGGWVVKYFLTYLTGGGLHTAQDGYFTSFVSQIDAPIVMMLVFLFLTIIVVLGGVEKGIEGFSKVVMPILILLILGISVFSMTLSYMDDGVVRTGLEGMRILMIPDFRSISVQMFLSILMDAMGQLFYSLSIAMGIMIVYGSYMRDDTDMPRSIGQIEIFDTGIAFLAGVMIIPAVYVFMGREGMSASGPGLMFITLPKVFSQMGMAGNIIGCLFFVMVLFAAITSSVSMLEAIVSSFMDMFGINRQKAVLIESAIALTAGLFVCLGYNVFYFELSLPNGAVAQILDVMDYISNNLLMPIVAISTCILVGWKLTPDFVIKESTKNGESFHRKTMYVVMLRYIAPAMLFALLIKAIGVLG